jgi:hypothetical protein
MVQGSPSAGGFEAAGQPAVPTILQKVREQPPDGQDGMP